MKLIAVNDDYIRIDFTPEEVKIIQEKTALELDMNKTEELINILFNTLKALGRANAKIKDKKKEKKDDK
jgi:hypothetical protein